ncbi:MAG: DUF2085 domain-containing protein [Chloroflexi bacterium]|nr:DUF2085 domain-containing protein [Chloroflexota bacterium]
MSQNPATGVEATISRWSYALVEKVARHWLLIFQICLAIFIGLPFLAPILDLNGMHEPAGIIYTVYHLTCHQLPSRSYFIGGQQFVYTPEQIKTFTGVDNVIFLFWQPIRDPHIGYQVAFCERDVGIYITLLLISFIFAALRKIVQPISWRIAWIFAVPIAIDGFSQLFGFRESNYILRTITGAIFGAGVGLFIFPLLQQAMDDVLESAVLRRTGPVTS